MHSTGIHVWCPACKEKTPRVLNGKELVHCIALTELRTAEPTILSLCNSSSQYCTLLSAYLWLIPPDRLYPLGRVALYAQVPLVSL